MARLPYAGGRNGMGTTAVENDFLKQLEEAHSASDEMIAATLVGEPSPIAELPAMIVENTRREMREGSIEPPQETVREELAMSALNQGLGSRPRSFVPPTSRMSSGGSIPRYANGGRSEEDEETIVSASGTVDDYGVWPAFRAVGSEVWDDVTDIDALDYALMGAGATGIGATVAGPAATWRRGARIARNIPNYYRTFMQTLGKGADRVVPRALGGRGPLSVGRADPRGANRAARILGRDPKTGQMVSEAQRLQKLGEAGSRLGGLGLLGYGLMGGSDSPEVPPSSPGVGESVERVVDDVRRPTGDPLGAPLARGSDWRSVHRDYLARILDIPESFEGGKERDRGAMFLSMASALATPEAAGGGIGPAMAAAVQQANERRDQRAEENLNRAAIASRLAAQDTDRAIMLARLSGSVPELGALRIAEDEARREKVFHLALQYAGTDPLEYAELIEAASTGMGSDRLDEIQARLLQVMPWVDAQLDESGMWMGPKGRP